MKRVNFVRHSNIKNILKKKCSHDFIIISNVAFNQAPFINAYYIPENKLQQWTQYQPICYKNLLII